MSKNNKENTNIKKKSTSKSTSTKKTTSSKNDSKTKKTTTLNKKDVAKKSTSKVNSNKTVSNKNNSKNTSKTATKSTNNAVKKIIKNEPKVNMTEEKLDKQEKETIVVEEVKLEDVISVENDKVTVKEESTKLTGAKIENAKYTIKRKNKTAIGIGVLISILGIIALLIALIANRIVDREFISDSQIIVMVIISIVVELMGAAIIIKET